MTQAERLDNLGRLGFDASYVVDAERIKVKCSQCQAVAINGMPCHETGCPNELHECRGCNASVPRGVRYCEDCQ